METGRFREGEGMVDAIKFLAGRHMAELRSETDRKMLMDEVKKGAEAEKKLLKGFKLFIPDGGARIRLTAKEKNTNIRPFIPAIQQLLILRNFQHDTELQKLDILESREDTSEYVLELEFGYRDEKTEKNPFIKRMQIVKEARNEKPSN